MNNDRRKKIQNLMEQFSNLLPLLEEVRNEEQDSLDNLPESLQMGERGDLMQDAINALDDAADYVNSAVEKLEELTNGAAV